MNVSLTAADFRTVGLTKADPVQSSLATVRPNIGPGPPCSCLLAVLLVTFWKVYFCNLDGNARNEHTARCDCQVVEGCEFGAPDIRLSSIGRSNSLNRPRQRPRQVVA